MDVMLYLIPQRRVNRSQPEFYENTAQYDPVLQSHCRMEDKDVEIRRLPRPQTPVPPNDRPFPNPLPGNRDPARRK